MFGVRIAEELANTLTSTPKYTLRHTYLYAKPSLAKTGEKSE